ncbi:hypothetical protein FACS1894172_08620 [Spirochaetia bacterium]|nr:hypothetical protein FACS1894164_09720 [Spirochaetia bacterium]GHU32279.1 hypothetical protein FACS1894172_08620 [Spirochaetia bacterium]
MLNVKIRNIVMWGIMYKNCIIAIIVGCLFSACGGIQVVNPPTAGIGEIRVMNPPTITAMNLRVVNPPDLSGVISFNSQSGIYVSIIQYGDTVVDLTNGQPVYLDPQGSGSTRLKNLLTRNYTASTASGSPVYYAMHKALATINTIKNSLPDDLDSVSIVSFAATNDQGSAGTKLPAIDGQRITSSGDYAAYIQQQLGRQRVNNKTIDAYSIGLDRANMSGADRTQFTTTLSNLVTGRQTSRVYRSTMLTNLSARFKTVASRLKVVQTKKNSALIYLILDNSTAVTANGSTGISTVRKAAQDFIDTLQATAAVMQ